MRTCCETCLFWEPERTRPERTRSETSYLGLCRRGTPSVTLTPAGARGIWPTVGRDQWCGEHTTVTRTEEAENGG